MIVVPLFQHDVLQALAVHAAPTREACAFVLTVHGTVVGVIPVENVAEEPESSFELGPPAAALWALLMTALPEVHLEAAVLFHSHVHGPAVASSGDIRWALSETRQLIYSVERDELRAFAFERGGEGDRQRLRAVEIPVKLVV